MRKDDAGDKSNSPQVTWGKEDIDKDVVKKMKLIEEKSESDVGLSCAEEGTAGPAPPTFERSRQLDDRPSVSSPGAVRIGMNREASAEDLSTMQQSEVWINAELVETNREQPVPSSANSAEAKQIVSATPLGSPLCIIWQSRKWRVVVVSLFLGIVGLIVALVVSWGRERSRTFTMYPNGTVVTDAGEVAVPSDDSPDE